MSTEQDSGYETGTWHERENYTCLWEGCKYASVNKAMIEQHVAAHRRTGKRNLSDADAAPPTAAPQRVSIVSEDEQAGGDQDD